jgi:predicted dehydrogenase
LFDKPMGKNILKAEKIKTLSLEYNITIWFNYLFMAGIEILKQLLIQKELGEVNSIWLDLGHGATPEDFDSWRLNKKSTCGGSHLDLGIHLIDLILHLSRMDSDSVHIYRVNYWSGFAKRG